MTKSLNQITQWYLYLPYFQQNDITSRCEKQPQFFARWRHFPAEPNSVFRYTLQYLARTSTGVIVLVVMAIAHKEI